MDTFSRRYRYAPDLPNAPILEEAPAWMRWDVWTRAVEPLLYVDEDSRYKNDRWLPLGVKALHREFCTLLRTEMETADTDSWHCFDRLRDHITGCDWFFFYDFVELVWRRLRKRAEDIWEIANEDELHFVEDYRKALNEVFADSLVQWRLEPDGKLHRVLEAEQARAIAEAKDALSESPAAATSLSKMTRFISTTALDPENAVKEAVTAAESFGRELFPEARNFVGVQSSALDRGPGSIELRVRAHEHADLVRLHAIPRALLEPIRDGR